MGWSSGSELAESIINTINANVKDDKVKETLYRNLINQFEDHDCDTMCECLGVDPIYDKVFNEMYPEE